MYKTNLKVKDVVYFRRENCDTNCSAILDELYIVIATDNDNPPNISLAKLSDDKLRLEELERSWCDDEQLEFAGICRYKNEKYFITLNESESVSIKTARINKGQRFALRELRCAGRPKLITTSDDRDKLVNKCRKMAIDNKNKSITGFKVTERNGTGKEETVYIYFSKVDCDGRTTS